MVVIANTSLHKFAQICSKSSKFFLIKGIQGYSIKSKAFATSSQTPPGINGFSDNIRKKQEAILDKEFIKGEVRNRLRFRFYHRRFH